MYAGGRVAAHELAAATVESKNPKQKKQKGEATAARLPNLAKIVSGVAM